MSVLKTGTPF